MNGTPCEGLIERIRGGDRDALDRWIADNRDRLKEWTGNGNGPQLVDASDVVQDVALYLVQRLESFRGSTEAEFRGWVRQMLRHACVDRARKEGRQAHGVAPAQAEGSQGPGPEPLNGLPGGQPTPSQVLVRQEERAALEKALDKLPDAQRTAVRLKHLEGWSLEDIARHLGRTPAAVGQLIYRGMRSLREELGGLLSAKG
jgi:RNA polymerase sigma-70 factor, ECF subfamily